MKVWTFESLLLSTCVLTHLGDVFVVPLICARLTLKILHVYCSFIPANYRHYNTNNIFPIIPVYKCILTP